MKYTSLRRALEKAGLKIEVAPYRNDYFFVKNKKDVLSWYEQDYSDVAKCVHIKRMDDERDSMSDYFPGSFYHTIKSVIETMTRTE